MKHFEDVFKKVFICLFVLLIFSLILCIIFIFTGNEIKVTTDINDYGNYKWNRYGDTADRIISSFFPDKISEDFSDVTYSYKANGKYSYAFEAYLEFTIDDAEKFDNYIKSISAEREWSVFAYDESYMECIVNDIYTLYHHHPDQTCEEADTSHNISHAEVTKILYSVEEQRIIYIALAVGENDSAPSDELCTFFNKFNIEAVEYEKE